MGTMINVDLSINDEKGEELFTSPGTYTWTCPANVFSVSVVCVGGGGGAVYYQTNPFPWGGGAGGGGGGLGWKNSIPVTPGNTYTVVVGAGGTGLSADIGSTPATDGGNSYFISTSTVMGVGGKKGANFAGGAGGTYVGDGGGNGGNGYYAGAESDFGGGGGAGGYSGNGGTGTGVNSFGLINPGSGGGGAGGWIAAVIQGNTALGTAATGGGGVGLFGQGANGTTNGQGGSGGENGTIGYLSGRFTTGSQFGGTGGAYGGGGAIPRGGGDNLGATHGGYGYRYGGDGGGGAVRIIWGENRAFPNTRTELSSTLSTLSTIRANTLYPNSGVSIGPGITIRFNEPEVTWAEASYVTPGTYSWTCPEDVTSVSVVCVGGGGSGSAGYNNGANGAGQYKGGGGGGLGWKNNIPVTPGQTYTVVVGAGGSLTTAVTTPPSLFYGYALGFSGGNSYFINESTVMGIGGAGGGRSGSNYANSAGGGYVGDGGGTGGYGGYFDFGGINRGAPGGGAGGYTGNGGDLTNVASGGGGDGGSPVNPGPGGAGDPGGGVGIYGEGTRGIENISQGGLHGGGGGGSEQGSSSPGGDGAVRIIWGNNRRFPSATTNTEFLQGNKKLLTTDLLAHLDFGDRRSYYEGFGLAFYDIRNNGGGAVAADGTNNTSHDENYGGVINFPAVDPNNSYYFLYYAASSPPAFYFNSDTFSSPQGAPSTKRKTFQLWIRFNTNITNNTVICAYADGGTGSNTYGYAIHAFANNAIAFRHRGRANTAPYSVVYSAPDTIKPNNWYLLTCSGIVSANANSVNIWLNDDPTPVISLSMGENVFFGSNSFFISDNYFSNAVAGNISVGGLYAYDKELTHAERVQNFDATKNRFLYST